MAESTFLNLYEIDISTGIIDEFHLGDYLTGAYGYASYSASEESGDGTWQPSEFDTNSIDVLGVHLYYYGHTPSGELVFFDQEDGIYLLLTNNDYSGGETTTILPEAQAVCFCQGTSIRTPAGDRSIENLAVGDEVLNASGAAVRITWIGRQTRHPQIAKMLHDLPIRITAGALGNGLPQRDLYVSPDHAMLVDCCLVHAQALVNGRTIEQVKDWKGNVEYFHIETENHELILAEGAAAETFVDNVSREKFDNYAEYQQLYPVAKPMQELDLPRVCFARQLPRAISRRLEAVADERLGKVAFAA